MKIDLQAYLDGSMDPQERLRAEDLLQHDPQAKRELDGLELFVQTVRVQALQEEIPFDRLAALIPQPNVKSEPQRHWWPRLELVGLAACIALACLFVAPSFFTQATVELETKDPVYASQWASDRMAMNVPVLDLGPDAPMFRVHEGKGRCCFDYQIDGKTYHLNVRPKGSMEDRPGDPIVLASGQPATQGSSVRWTQGAYDLSLNGPDAKVEKNLADRASKILRDA